MNRRNTRGKEAPHKVRTFGYLLQKAVSLCLLFILLALPLAPTFANETEVPVVTEEVVVSDETELSPSLTSEVLETEEQLSPDLDSSEVPVEDVISEDSGLPQPDSEPVSETEDQESVIESETLPETPLEDTEDEIITEGPTGDFETSEPDSDDEIADDTEDENDNGEETTDSEEVVAEEIVPEEHTVVVGTVTNDENRYSFSKQECTVVGDGSYYCAKTNETPQAINSDRIFAATDRQGDKEIFIEHDGEIAPLTENEVDDDAPYYDDVEESVVWHRLLEGRYQIMSYSFDSKKETQLTHDSYNNMEPSRYGDAVVWQAWVGNNWEIMLLEDETLTQLTENTEPDIAPSVNGGYIVWQAQERGVWYAKVYDRATGDIETIENAGGLSIENARFVLVYDTKHENGDIETQGYDLKNKRIIPLSATPASAPEQLPEPDETGEKRALIQVPSQVKPKADDENLGSGGPSPDGPEPVPEPEGISDVVVGTTTDATAGQGPVSATSTEHIPELIIGSSATATSQIPTHIEDLVIEPFSTSSDPQGDIAEEA